MVVVAASAQWHGMVSSRGTSTTIVVLAALLVLVVLASNTSFLAF